jgi:hypothetical protein
MRFTVDADQGHAITGWVAPDNPLAVSRVRLSVHGKALVEVPATEFDAGVRANGWHSSGLCRFVVDEQLVPGLSGISTLEIHDVDTNVLIHRRYGADAVCNEKAILLGTSVVPDRVLEARLHSHFRASYFNIEKFSEETLTLILNNPFLRSCVCSGSILIPRYEAAINAGASVSILLVQDPCVEMASRMLWLQDRVMLSEDEAQSWRLGELIEAVKFSANYDYGNIRSLKRFFQMLPEPAYRLIFNPLTRLLGTRLPDDRVLPANSIIAVEILSRLDVVGHRDHYEAFVESVFDRLGIESAAPLPLPTPIRPAALELADRLRSLKLATDFLVFDEVISQSVRKAVQRSWTA